VFGTDRRAASCQEFAQRRDRALRLFELCFHLREVLEDDAVPSAGTLRFEHRADLLEGHLEVSEATDHVRGRDLRCGIEAITRRSIDVGRRQQADLVVVAQRLDTQMRRPGELTDAQQDSHEPSLSDGSPVRRSRAWS
jgi:hypothetical protein